MICTVTKGEIQEAWKLYDKAVKDRYGAVNFEYTDNKERLRAIADKALHWRDGIVAIRKPKIEQPGLLEALIAYNPLTYMSNDGTSNEKTIRCVDLRYSTNISRKPHVVIGRSTEAVEFFEYTWLQVLTAMYGTDELVEIAEDAIEKFNRAQTKINWTIVKQSDVLKELIKRTPTLKGCNDALKLIYGYRVGEKHYIFLASATEKDDIQLKVMCCDKDEMERARHMAWFGDKEVQSVNGINPLTYNDDMDIFSELGLTLSMPQLEFYKICILKG